jgi:hemoglobin/transferrin/lactoferrin receptor protein
LITRYLLLLFIFFCTSISVAQEVIVIDFETNFPIRNATIYAENNPNVIYTDTNGKADISIFKENEVISVNHLSYVEVEFLKRTLKNSNPKIYLHSTAEALDEVILSTGRQKELRKRVAEYVEVNQAREIKRKSPQTSADLLATIPGIKVQKSQFGGGSPVLRGMEANRILLVVDGVRMNNAIYRSGHLQSSITVSPSILDRTEVVFGPSSVIYGSDALGGVIHYFTKTPKVNKEKMVDYNLMSRYSTVNDEVTNQGSFQASFKKWASLTSFSYSQFGDLKMGKNRNHGFEDWGKVFEYSNNTDDFYNSNTIINSDSNIQRNTGFNQSDFLQKFYFELSKETNLTVNFQHSISSNIPRFDRLSEYSNGELKFAEWYYGPQKRLLLSTQLNINPNKKWLNKGVITASYQNLKESRVQRKFNSLDRLYRNEAVDVYNLNGDFSAQLSKESNRNLSYGFEASHNKVNSNSFGKTLSVSGNQILGFTNDFIVQSRYPDGGSSYTSGALYSNYRQDLNEKATLNSGVRYTYTNLQARWIDETYIALPNNDITLENSSLTATLGYAFRPNENWQLNTVVSSGFRSPNIDDVGKIREKNGIVSVPNINLKPEYVYNAEIGVLKYLNDKKFNFGLNVYYTLLNNYIARESFSINGGSTILYDDEIVATFANLNNKNAYIVGSTFSFKGRFQNYWSTNGSVTYTKGKSYDLGLPLSSIPPVFGNLELIFAKNKYELALNYRFNGTKKIEDYNLVEGIDNEEQTPYDSLTGQHVGTPNWNTFSFYSKYKISETIDFQFRVDNIFDQHYKEFASAISTPGRNFSVSVFIN